MEIVRQVKETGDIAFLFQNKDTMKFLILKDIFESTQTDEMSVSMISQSF